jgi:hypothetical protein
MARWGFYFSETNFLCLETVSPSLNLCGYHLDALPYLNGSQMIGRHSMLDVRCSVFAFVLKERSTSYQPKDRLPIWPERSGVQINGQEPVGPTAKMAVLLAGS